MNHDEARRLLNSELKLRAQRWCTDAEFGSALRRFGSDYEPGEEGDFAEQAADGILFSRDVASEMQGPGGLKRQSKDIESVEPPEWWTAEWQRRVGFWVPAGRRESIRRRLGLVADDGVSTRPCTDIEEMWTVLRAARARERRTGQTWQLYMAWFPRALRAGSDDLEVLWEVWDGDVDRSDASLYEDRSRYFDAEQPLYSLAHQVEMMEEELGTRPQEAFGLLLMDEPVTARWIDVEANGFSEPELVQYRITVYSPMVPATELARAYATTRRRDFGDAKDKRAPRLWPHRAAIFMDKWEEQDSRGGWKAAFDGFAERYPGQPYRTMRTFRGAVYDRRRKDAQWEAD